MYASHYCLSTPPHTDKITFLTSWRSWEFQSVQEIKTKTLNANILETKTSQHLRDPSLEIGSQNTHFWKIWPGVPLWRRTYSLEKLSPRSKDGWEANIVIITISKTSVCVCVCVWVWVCVSVWVCVWVSVCECVLASTSITLCYNAIVISIASIHIV